MGTDLYLAFTTGMLGGFGHCIGMCGPIVAALTWNQALSSDTVIVGTWAPQLLYHTGRVLTYTVIGAVMGLSGSFVNVAGRITGVQNVVALGAGLLMVLMGLSIAGLWRAAPWLEGQNNVVLSTARKVIASSSPYRSFSLGLVLGLLPCGLSYTVFIAAAGTGGMFPGALLALLFGLGTLPAVLLFGVLVSSLSAKLRNRIYRAGGIAIIVMGIVFILRGVRAHAGL
jgi:sulfite exporter TauE/SafE